MKVPLSWLREYCDPGLDVAGVEERLTMTGTKVEAIHRHHHHDPDHAPAGGPGGGEGAVETVVAGGPGAGQGAGEKGPHGGGPGGGQGPGERASDGRGAAEEVLELEVTPNRPDCLGVYGVARELHAATGAPLAPEPWREDPGSPGALEGADVDVRCPDLCPRFTGRLFEHVTVGSSPSWLQARLRAAGQRPIDSVVDITNYVMLLTGQPLHVFDLDRLAGHRLTVRRAENGEQVETLDGQTRRLDRGMIVIEDAHGPTSIAGLMGGARSEVGPGTTRVLLEVANWHGPSIHRASWALGLRSEASSRFEKGLAPEQCMWAQAVASALMVELCGASLAAGTIDVGGQPDRPPAIRLRERRVGAILGVDIDRARQAEILQALDFGTVATPDGLDVTPPPVRRQDVTREIDLIEEVARIDGLQRLPATLPARRGAAGRLTHAQRVRRAAEDALAGRGLHEIVGWSFAHPELLDRLLLEPDHPMREVVIIDNPLSADQSIMRPTLLGSLLDAARHNVSRNRPRVTIFESGATYRAVPGDLPADEHHTIAALLTGPLEPPSWRGGPGEADFFAAKALLGSLLDSFHVHWSVRPALEGRWPFLHPARAAEVLARWPSDGRSAGRPVRLGFLGEVHPRVAGAWDVSRAGTFAIDLAMLALVVPEAVSFEPYGPFPVLHQDLAVTLPANVSARELLHLVRRAGAEMLEGAEIFDVYTGPQVGEGRRSLALTLSFRARERTLTDEDVGPVRARIVEALASLGGELRGG